MHSDYDIRYFSVIDRITTYGQFYAGCSAYSILPPMVVNVYVAYIVYRTLRVVVIPT